VFHNFNIQPIELDCLKMFDFNIYICEKLLYFFIFIFASEQ